jgi:RNA polymerase sigma-70 factor (sigma-E family)
LLRTAYLVVWDLTEAEDLVQECLLKVARRWPRVRRMDQPRAYARRVLLNQALDGARRRSRQSGELERFESGGVSARPDETAARDLSLVDTRSQLIGALSTLPPRQRAVLVLRYFEDLPEAQIADSLGCSVGTVKSQISRGLARLQATMTSPNDPDHLFSYQQESNR